MSSKPLQHAEDGAPSDRYLRRLVCFAKDVQRMVEGSTVEVLMAGKYRIPRRNLVRYCVSLLANSEVGLKSLEITWRSGYYTVLSVIRGSELNRAAALWSEMEIRCFAGELCYIMGHFPYLSAMIYVYLGDLRRHSWIIFKRDIFRDVAATYYRNAVLLDEHFGLPLNQLGLLEQDSNPRRAVMLFLLGAVSENPYRGSYGNVLAYLAQKDEGDNDPSVAVTVHCLTAFNRVEFDELKLKLIDEIRVKFDEGNSNIVAYWINLLTLSCYLLFHQEKQQEARNIIEMILQVNDKIFEKVEELLTPETKNVETFRRRQASKSPVGSSSSGDDIHMNNDGFAEQKKDGSGIKKAGVRKEEEESDEPKLEGAMKTEEEENSQASDRPSVEPTRKKQDAETLLVALTHFGFRTASIYHAERTPLALKAQFGSFCQRLTHMLNFAQVNIFVASISSDPPRFVRTGAVGIFHLASDQPWKLLPCFARRFVDCPDTPVEFDGSFRFAPKSASSHEEVMVNMARRRLVHETEKEKAIAKLPVYVVPEVEVLLQRLWVVKGIVKKTNLILVISGIRQLDKQKKKSGAAREALRYISAALASPNGRIRVRPAQSPMQVAEELAAQTPLANSTIVTILTMSHEEKASHIKGITFANAEKFYRSLKK